LVYPISRFAPSEVTGGEGKLQIWKSAAHSPLLKEETIPAKRYNTKVENKTQGRTLPKVKQLDGK